MRPTSQAALVAVLALGLLAPLAADAGGPRATQSRHYYNKQLKLNVAKAKKHLRWGRTTKDAAKAKKHNLHFAKSMMKAQQNQWRRNAKTNKPGGEAHRRNLLRSSAFDKFLRAKTITPRTLRKPASFYRRNTLKNKARAKTLRKLAKRELKAGNKGKAQRLADLAMRAELTAEVNRYRYNAKRNKTDAHRYLNTMRATALEKVLRAPKSKQKAPTKSLAEIGTALATTADGATPTAPSTPSTPGATEAPKVQKAGLPAVITQPAAPQSNAQARVQKRLNRAISIAERILRLPSLPQDQARLNKLLKIVAPDKVAGMLHDTGVQLDPRSAAILNQAQRRIVAARRGNDPGPGHVPGAANPTIVTSSGQQPSQGGALVPYAAAPQQQPRAGALVPVKPAPAAGNFGAPAPYANTAAGKAAYDAAQKKSPQARSAAKKAEAKRPGKYRTMRNALEVGNLGKALAEYKLLENDASHGGLWSKVKRLYARRKLRKGAEKLAIEATKNGLAVELPNGEVLGENEMMSALAQNYRESVQQLREQNNGKLPREALPELKASFNQYREMMTFDGAMRVLKHIEGQHANRKGVAKALTSVRQAVTGLLFGSAKRSKKRVEKKLITNAAYLMRDAQTAGLGYGMLQEATRRGLAKRYSRKYKRSVRTAKRNLKRSLKKGIKEGDPSAVDISHQLKYAMDNPGKEEMDEASAKTMSADITKAQKRYVKRLSKQLAWRILHAKLAPQMDPYVDNGALWKEISKTLKALDDKGERMGFFARRQVAWVSKYRNRGTFGQDFGNLIRHPLTGDSWSQMWLHIQRVPVGTVKLPFRLLKAIARGGNPSQPPIAPEKLQHLMQANAQYRGELDQATAQAQQQQYAEQAAPQRRGGAANLQGDLAGF